LFLLSAELDELEQSNKTLSRDEIQNVFQQENAKEFEHLQHQPQQEVGMMKAGEAEEAPEV
jgi:ribonuclease I